MINISVYAADIVKIICIFLSKSFPKSVLSWNVQTFWSDTENE